MQFNVHGKLAQVSLYDDYASLASLVGLVACARRQTNPECAVTYSDNLLLNYTIVHASNLHGIIFQSIIIN